MTNNNDARGFIVDSPCDRFPRFCFLRRVRTVSDVYNVIFTPTAHCIYVYIYRITFQKFLNSVPCAHSGTEIMKTRRSRVVDRFFLTKQFFSPPPVLCCPLSKLFPSDSISRAFDLAAGVFLECIIRTTTAGRD